MKPNNAMAQQEHEILNACALRFDGYKYREATGWDFQTALKKAIETSQLPGSNEEKLALFFMLQRWLMKWGGERERLNGATWKLFRSLFLELWSIPIPPEYSALHIDLGWPNKFNLSESVRVIQTIHDTTKYDAGT
jgi:hypothetical protein